MKTKQQMFKKFIKKFFYCMIYKHISLANFIFIENFYTCIVLKKILLFFFFLKD